MGASGRLGQEEEPAPWEGINNRQFLGPLRDVWVRGHVGLIPPFALSHKERKLCAHPRLEIYQQDQIYFMCPLARQGDFYVPEVKETERKFRGPAEASDAQVDGTGTGQGCCRGKRVGPPPWLGGTVGVQAKLDRGGRRDPSTHVLSYLFLDTQIHVGVASHVTPGNADTKTLPGFPSDAAGVPLETQITDSWMLMGGG